MVFLPEYIVLYSIQHECFPASCTEYLLFFLLGIRKKSKVPGVMITQFVEQLPEGKTTPDFTRKPIALTIQEGKSDTAVFVSA